jgi:multiple sugar transport system permease protein
LFVLLDAASEPGLLPVVSAPRPFRRRLLDAAQPYLYLAPALAGVGVWIYWPIIRTLRLSTVSWNLLPNKPKVNVGADNYRDVLELPEMRQAIWNTVKYTLGLVPFSVIFPLAVALLIFDMQGRLRAVYRAFVFLPVLMAPVVVAVVWRWILHPTQGLLNGWLDALGITGPSYLNDKRYALWTIVGITGWKLMGFSVLIFSAGLANVNSECIAAAQVDGASRWQTIRSVTLPLMSPTIMFMLLLTVLLSAQWTFPLINVLTDGGPIGATTNVYLLLYEFGFRNFNVGFSSAAAVLFFVFFGALALFCVKLIDRFSFFDA